jgi:hypothetical protein
LQIPRSQGRCGWIASQGYGSQGCNRRSWCSWHKQANYGVNITQICLEAVLTKLSRALAAFAHHVWPGVPGSTAAGIGVRVLPYVVHQRIDRGARARRGPANPGPGEADMSGKSAGTASILISRCSRFQRLGCVAGKPFPTL